MKDTIVSFYESLSQPGTVKNKSLLECVIDIPNQHKDAIAYGRRILAEMGKPTYKAFKSTLPVYTPSGIFSYRNMEGLIQHSGYICIDVDCESRDEAELAKLVLSDNAHTAYCGLSLSQKGCFSLISIKHPCLHVNHWLSLQDDLNDCLRSVRTDGSEPLTIDAACKDISRARVISYDENPYLSYDTIPYEGLSAEIRDIKKPTPDGKLEPVTYGNDGRIGLSYDKEDVTKRKAIVVIQDILASGVNVTAEYNDWLKLAFACVSIWGAAGENVFHHLSQLDSRYKESECKKLYQSALKQNPICDATAILAIAQRNGFTIPSDKTIISA